MFWGPSDGLRQVLSTRHAALGLKDGRHTVMAQGGTWCRARRLRRAATAALRRLPPATGTPLAGAADRGHLLRAVGCGPHPPRGSRVWVMPPMTDCHRLARLLANCDICAPADDQATFGLGAPEAMACGVPVMLSASDGLSELAEAGGPVGDRAPPARLGRPAGLCARHRSDRAVQGGVVARSRA